MKKLIFLLMAVFCVNYTFAQQISNDSLARKAIKAYQANKPEEGAVILNEILSKEPEHSIANYIKGVNYFTNGDYKNAKTFFTIAEKKDKSNVTLYYYLAVSIFLENKGKVSDEEWIIVKRYFEEALKLAPGATQIYMDRAKFTFNRFILRNNISKHETEKNEALSDFNKVISLQPDEADEARFYIAKISSDARDYTTAVKNIDVILKRDKQPVSLLYQTAGLIYEAYTETNKYDEGIKFLENCITRIEKVDTVYFGKKTPISNSRDFEDGDLRRALLSLFYVKYYKLGQFNKMFDDVGYTKALENKLKYKPNISDYNTKIQLLVYKKEYTKALELMKFLKETPYASEFENDFKLLTAKVDFETNKGSKQSILEIMEKEIANHKEQFYKGFWGEEAYLISINIKAEQFEKNKNFKETYLLDSYLMNTDYFQYGSYKNNESFKSLKLKIAAAFKSIKEKIKLKDGISIRDFSYVANNLYTFRDEKTNMQGLLNEMGELVYKANYDNIEYKKEENLFLCYSKINDQKLFGLLDEDGDELIYMSDRDGLDAKVSAVMSTPSPKKKLKSLIGASSTNNFLGFQNSNKKVEADNQTYYPVEDFLPIVDNMVIFCPKGETEFTATLYNESGSENDKELKNSFIQLIAYYEKNSQWSAATKDDGTITLYDENKLPRAKYHQENKVGYLSIYTKKTLSYNLEVEEKKFRKYLEGYTVKQFTSTKGSETEKNEHLITYSSSEKLFGINAQAFLSVEKNRTFIEFSFLKDDAKLIEQSLLKIANEYVANKKWRLEQTGGSLSLIDTQNITRCIFIKYMGFELRVETQK